MPMDIFAVTLPLAVEIFVVNPPLPMELFVVILSLSMECFVVVRSLPWEILRGCPIIGHGRANSGLARGEKVAKGLEMTANCRLEEGEWSKSDATARVLGGSREDCSQWMVD